MTPDRFAELADAYGGDIDRWPASERAAARAHLLAHPGASPVLAAQAGLDTALAAWTVPPPNPTLPRRIAASVARRQTYSRRIRLWLSGAGAAAALASGVAAGMSFVASTSPPRDAPPGQWPPGQWPTGQWYETSVLGAPLDLGADSATERDFR